MSTFDFGDGPVPAHQHKNPRGSLGGWVADTAYVASSAHVGENARVYGKAQVSGSARVTGTARVFGSASVSDNAHVAGNATVRGHARVSDNVYVAGAAIVRGHARVYGDARVLGEAVVGGGARVYGYACVAGEAIVSGAAVVTERHHLIYLEGLGENGGLTMFRTAGGGHMIQAGCWSGTLKAMRVNLAMRDTHGWNNPERCEGQYLSVLPALAFHKKLWKREG